VDLAGITRLARRGVIVDAMSDVTNVPPAAIKAPPVFRDVAQGGLANGIVTLDSKMLTLLDVDRIVDVSAAAVAPAA
jgi:chemotaxis signal transduction protein